jgi:hypothetical protein
MARRSEFENNLLDQVGRSVTRLTVDDVADIVGDALRGQRKQILAHVGRLVRLQEVKAAAAPSDERFKNLHRRLLQVESEIRRLKKGGAR